MARGSLAPPELPAGLGMSPSPPHAGTPCPAQMLLKGTYVSKAVAPRQLGGRDGGPQGGQAEPSSQKGQSEGLS